MSFNWDVGDENGSIFWVVMLRLDLEDLDYNLRVNRYRKKELK